MNPEKQVAFRFTADPGTAGLDYDPPWARLDVHSVEVGKATMIVGSTVPSPEQLRRRGRHPPYFRTMFDETEREAVEIKPAVWFDWEGSHPDRWTSLG